MNFDDMKRLHIEARRCGHGSKAWIEFATVMMAEFPQIYDKAKELNATFFQLRNQVQTGKEIVSAGVELMTKEQVGAWAGVRSFLEQTTEDYLTEAEMHELHNSDLSTPCKVYQGTHESVGE